MVCVQFIGGKLGGSTVLHAMAFDDGRGEYPDVIRARVPRGFRAQVKQAAQAAGVPLSELVRRAIMEHVQALQSGDSDAR